MGLIVVAEAVPGEDAVTIGQQQTVNAEVAAHGYESVVFAPMRVGKPKSFIELYHHKFCKVTKNFLKKMRNLKNMLTFVCKSRSIIACQRNNRASKNVAGLASVSPDAIK